MLTISHRLKLLPPPRRGAPGQGRWCSLDHRGPEQDASFQSLWVPQSDLKLTHPVIWLPLSWRQPEAPLDPLPLHTWMWLLPPVAAMTPPNPHAAAHDFVLSFSPTLPVQSAPNRLSMTHPLPQLLDTHSGRQRGKRYLDGHSSLGDGDQQGCQTKSRDGAMPAINMPSKSVHPGIITYVGSGFSRRALLVDSV